MRTIRGHKGIDLAHGISVDSAIKEAASAAAHGAETVRGRDFVGTSVVNALAEARQDAALRAPDHHPAGHGHGAGHGHAHQDATGDVDLVDTGDSATGDIDLVATGDGDAGDGAEADTTTTLFALNPPALDPDRIDSRQAAGPEILTDLHASADDAAQANTELDTALPLLDGGTTAGDAGIGDRDDGASAGSAQASELDIAADSANAAREGILTETATALLNQANTLPDIGQDLLGRGAGDESIAGDTSSAAQQTTGTDATGDESSSLDGTEADGTGIFLVTDSPELDTQTLNSGGDDLLVTDLPALDTQTLNSGGDDLLVTDLPGLDTQTLNSGGDDVLVTETHTVDVVDTGDGDAGDGGSSDDEDFLVTETRTVDVIDARVGDALERDFADFTVASGLHENAGTETAVTDAADSDQATSISIDIDDPLGADLSTSWHDASA